MSNPNNIDLSTITLNALNAEILRAEAELARWEALLAGNSPTCATIPAIRREIASQESWLKDCRDEWNALLVAEEAA